MIKNRHGLSLAPLVLLASLFLLPARASCQDSVQSPRQIVEAVEIVRKAVQYWRDDSSEVLATMRIHRADWQRTSELRSWTKGMDQSLVRFVAPAKDSGNATLTKGDDVWTFTPKTNRVIKIPSSMKSQSWMGSDFSYQDLSRDDEIVEQYTHKLLKTEDLGDRKVFVVESIPLDDAPVVWGKEILKIRDDKIILEHSFYDQDMVLVKKLTTRKIATLGGKVFPVTMRMVKAETPEEWTEIVHSEASFGQSLSSSFFTLSNLRNPRR